MSDGYSGDDGSPGSSCDGVSQPGEENQANDDGSFESGEGWENSQVAPPIDGAFAERFQVQGTIEAIHLHLTQPDASVTHRADLYIWADDGGHPGQVLAVFPNRDPGPIATIPSVSSHRFAIHYTVPPGADPVIWVGVWGNWPGQPLDWYLAADTNGPGDGSNSYTHIAPGQGYPEGWQPVNVAFPGTHALGIGLEVRPLGACCAADARGCCSITTQGACQAAGGTFLGVGTSCETSPCVALPPVQTVATDCFDLTVTDHGSLGFVDEAHSQGLGLRVPPGGLNQLRIGGLWVGLGPDSVLHRDYDLDPPPRWEVAACPAGQVHLESVQPSRVVTWSAMEASLHHDGGPTTFRNDQRTRIHNTPEACGYAILEFTGQPPATPGVVNAYYGLFLDLDLNGTPFDDFGQVDPGRPLVYLTDFSGLYVGLRVLHRAGAPTGGEHLTLIPNAAFVDPQGYVTEADKWAFLSAADPGHVITAAGPGNYGILAARQVTLTGSATPEWPTDPQFAVALVVAYSLPELEARSDQAQTDFEQEVVAVSEPPATDRAAICAPNPFRVSTAIRIGLATAAPVAIDLIDVTGRRVRRLARGRLDRGEHTFTWDGRSDQGVPVPTGVYFVRTRIGERTTSRMVFRLQ